jgi:holo-[acyl-carrier protein] synthase
MDLVDIVRVDAMLDRHGARARRRVFTPDEVAYCEGMARPAQHFAARFAAKEACYKALSGTEQARGISWQDIAVARSERGEPSLVLTGHARVRADELQITRIHLSLTHSEGVAGAVVVLERD